VTAGTRTVKSLAKVLGHSEDVAALVTESARGLSEAAEKLTAVNQALESEIRDRDLVDHQLAASKEQEAVARHAALHDILTGLPNRALFNDRLEHGFAQARRHGWSIAVMFLDLDKFKDINDAHGHDAGDAVLKAVARRLGENARGDDTVSRLGGDEFLYLLTEIRDEKNIAAVVEKILGAVQAPLEVAVGGRDVSLSIRASIGISIFPRDGTTVEALITGADRAMYRAKQEKSGYSFDT
jgi:diguanylate cyclase (GGDEF)-like protein